jgi:hypothetical protein
VADQKQMASLRWSNGSGGNWGNQAEINLLPVVVVSFFLRVDSRDSQQRERRQRPKNHASGYAAMELLPAIVVHFFLLLPLI